MLKHTLTLSARDLLFFRDARPLGGSDEGAGGRWPLPNVLHAAVLSAFHDRWPELDPSCESRHTNWKDKEKARAERGKSPDRSSLRFGGLRTIGPFPYIARGVNGRGGGLMQAGLYLPSPADLVPGGIMHPVRLPAGTASNLPAPLRYAVAAATPPSKEDVEPWLAVAEFVSYLQGRAQAATTRAGDLYLTETRPGVGIDPATHAHREHVFYQAEYLRLREGVELCAWAHAETRKSGQNSSPAKDLLAEFVATGIDLRFGGQGGVASGRVTPAVTVDLPKPAPGQKRLKWILLTPALFTAGWRPGWVDTEGRIRLTVEQNGAKQPISGRLVAARVGKPILVSGWKLDVAGDHSGGRPKATRLLLAPGTVYYFELDDAQAAQRFIDALHLKPKSDELGEKGFGLGVCGTWDFLDLKSTTANGKE